MAATTINQSANDTFPAKSNGTERTVGLSNVPADFGNATAVDITVDGSLAGFSNDASCELDVWIETAGGTLLASDASTWKQVQSRSSNGSFTTSALSFSTINTTANKADWDGALLRYRQSITGINMGADSVAYTTTTTTSVDITYNAGSSTTPKSVSQTAIGTSALTRILDYFRTLSSTAVGTASNTRIVTHFLTLSASGIGSSGISQANVFTRTLASTAIGSVAFSQASVVGKILAATAIGSVAHSKIITLSVIASATAIGSVSITKKIIKTLSSTALGTIGLIKKIGKPFNFSATGSLSNAKNIGITLSSTAIGTSVESDAILTTQANNSTGIGTGGSTQSFIAGSGAALSIIKGVILAGIALIGKKIKGVLK